jgi:hypothetical protein
VQTGFTTIPYVLGTIGMVVWGRYAERASGDGT